MAEILISDYSGVNDEEAQKYKLLEPLIYLHKNGTRNSIGKFKPGIRSWLNIPEEQVEKVFGLVETFMFTIWAVDDVCDESSIREAIPTSHLIFGMPSTINAVNYAFSLILQKLTEAQKPKFVDYYLEYIIKMFRGNGLEICWRNRGICPTEEEYMNYVVPKTSGSANLMFRMMQAFSDDTEKNGCFTKTLTELGNICQILNDYYNLQSTQYTSLKGYCMDISEGTFTFPLIHAVQTHPENDQVFSILLS